MSTVYQEAMRRVRTRLALLEDEYVDVPWYRLLAKVDLLWQKLCVEDALTALHQLYHTCSNVDRLFYNDRYVQAENEYVVLYLLKEAQFSSNPQ